MTGTYDMNQVAIAAVGQASLEDPRIKTSDRGLIHGIAVAIKKSMLRLDTREAVEAVEAFYALGVSERVDGAALVAIVRRRRQAAYLAESDTRNRYLEGTQRDEWHLEMASIRSWSCEDCGADPGVLCTNPLTGLPMNGACAGHPSRIRQAYGERVS